MKKSILAALLCGVLANTSFAFAETQPTEDVNIAGEWSFVADTGDECTFSGSALLIETETPGSFSCQLTATQVCVTETWQVRQSCAAKKVNSQVVIVSQIEEFVQGEPNRGYREDNFKLTIKSPDLMTGVLVSWGWHLAEFYRADGTIS